MAQIGPISFELQIPAWFVAKPQKLNEIFRLIRLLIFNSNRNIQNDRISFIFIKSVRWFGNSSHILTFLLSTHLSGRFSQALWFWAYFWVAWKGMRDDDKKSFYWNLINRQIRLVIYYNFSHSLWHHPNVQSFNLLIADF